MMVCSGSIPCFLTGCWSPSSAFLMIPSRLSMLLLSCCREVEAVVVFRDGGQSDSLPFSPLVAVVVSFGMLFSCL